MDLYCSLTGILAQCRKKNLQIFLLDLYDASIERRVTSDRVAGVFSTEKSQAEFAEAI